MSSDDEFSDLFDHLKYPLHEKSSEEYLQLVSIARQQLANDGCAVMQDLILPKTIHKMRSEISSQKHTTHFSVESMNPYFHVTHNPDFPMGHPVNTFIERSSGFIPGDSWNSSMAIYKIFHNHDLTGFLKDCLETDSLYCYADPLAGLTANILDPGQQFAWHFDTNEFAVTALVEEAQDGGLFEYVPMIRNSEEESFDEVQKVLDGQRSRVKVLELRPGDLQIFRGRHSLHRVTRVGQGSTPRHAAIFAYTIEPGVIGRVERTMQLFGRVLPEHLYAERVRSDALID